MEETNLAKGKVDYSQFVVSEEEQDLYKFLYEEDGHGYSIEELPNTIANNYETCDETDEFGYYDYEDENYDDQYRDPPYREPTFSEDYFQEDYLDDFEYEDRIFGSSGKNLSMKSITSSEKLRKSSRGSRGSSNSGSIKKGSKSEDNLKALERRKSKNSESGSSKSTKTSGKHSVLYMVEATKQTNYWSVLADHDCQAVLEYGVVEKVLGNSQFDIFCGYQHAIGVTLRGFLHHFPEIEVGDVIVYQTLDSNFNFQLNKVYISAKCDREEIHILYRRGELPPSLYHFHRRIREQSSQVLTSQKGNRLPDFLYQTPEKISSSSAFAFHATEEMKRPSMPIPVPSPAPSDPSNNRSLKELYHFNSMILEKIVDYFLDYLRQQTQMKSMIIKITNYTIRTTASVGSFHPTTTTPSTSTTRAEEATTIAEEEGEEEEDEEDYKPKASKKVEKSKSKVGILLYLFFLESLHHVLYSLPTSLPLTSHSELLDDPRYLRGQAYLQSQQRQGIQQLFALAISSYNMNNCVGKLIRFLFQQMFFYLCDNHCYYRMSRGSSHKKWENSFLTPPEIPSPSQQFCSDHPSAPRRSHSQQYYHQMIERISHMDIITNILPFLEMDDLYQCFFLMIPQSILQHLNEPSTTSPACSATSITTATAATSVFRGKENLITIIQHFFHEINQNPQYIGIAQDIYDIFSCNIDWEQFLSKL